MAIERGIRYHRFAFVVSGVLYGYVGITAQVLGPVVFGGETVASTLTLAMADGYGGWLMP